MGVVAAMVEVEASAPVEVAATVRGKGYDEGHDSWENEDNLVGTSDDEITDFYRTHPSAP